MTAKDTLERMMTSKPEEREDAIALATAGAAGMAFLLRMESIERSAGSTDRVNPSDPIGIVGRVTSAVESIVPQWGPVIDKAKYLRDYRGKKSFIMGLIVPDLSDDEWMGLGRIGRLAMYGSIAVALAGWLYWIQQHPEVVEKALDTLGVVAQAGADVLEEAVDWMPL